MIFKFINIITSLKLLNDIEKYSELLKYQNNNNYSSYWIIQMLLNNIQDYSNLSTSIIIRIVELLKCYWILFNIIKSN